ncbi:MAG: hypothetical protein K6F58_07705 [Bacteroidales bacterium]|nr:hypothetical protein [Bacteroidales bacterium]
MNGFKRICAVIVGSVLFISGVLKIMDPLGTSLIVEDYFRFFHLGFLSGASYVSGLALSLFESVLGVILITGVWRKFAAVASLCLLALFTIITAILWIAGASFDCGCFGKALHLEHWQSFVKNVVLLGLWAAAFLPFTNLGEPQKIKFVSFGIGAASVALFCLWSLLSIPLVDFTSMKPGTEFTGAFNENFDDITAAVYTKDGREGAFTPDCPPDSTWTFVRYETYSRGLTDFAAAPQTLSFCDASGEYADSLATKGKVIIVSAYNPAAVSARRTASLEEFAKAAEEKGYSVLYLVAGTPETLESASAALANLIYFADRRALMTLNRSNGGVTFVSDGNIVAKWAAGALPSGDELGKLAKRDPVEYMMRRNNKGKVRLQGFLLYTFAVMLLL